MVEWQPPSNPFGLSSAPRTFTKLLKPVTAFLQERGVHLVLYIDEILIMANMKEKATSHLILTLDILEYSPIMKFYGQSKIDFLVFLVNSVAMDITLPQEKIQRIMKEAQSLLQSQTITASHLARITGIPSSCVPAVIPASLHYRDLQMDKNGAVA